VVQSGLLRIFDIDNCLLKRIDFTYNLLDVKMKNALVKCFEEIKQGFRSFPLFLNLEL
jgi:phage regulator Rha-like protein